MSYTQLTISLKNIEKTSLIKLSPFASKPDAMINPQQFEPLRG